MFELSKTFRFEAAHRLPQHDGKCRRLHGHSWVMTVTVKADHVANNGPKTGMGIDYSDISAAVRPLLDEYLDHHFLNKTLRMESPTSEMVAEWAFRMLRPCLPGLYSVTIEETCTSKCVYIPV